jgi:hypothetical protein
MVHSDVHSCGTGIAYLETQAAQAPPSLQLQGSIHDIARHTEHASPASTCAQNSALAVPVVQLEARVQPQD